MARPGGCFTVTSLGSRPDCACTASPRAAPSCGSGRRRSGIAVPTNRSSRRFRIRRAVGSGRLGTVRWVEMAWQKSGIAVTEKWRWHRGRGGGKIFDLGAHLLDQLLLLFPQPVSGVFCRLHTDFPNVDVESHAM